MTQLPIGKIVGVIPAHLASVRFPRKILFPLLGLPMIEHVRRRALMAKGIDNIYVATCDDEIADVVRGFGGKVIITSRRHNNGTTRVAEAIAEIDCEYVLLLQGDEPLLLPRHLEAILQAMVLDPDSDAWNATGTIETPEELDRHSFVKCAITSQSRILYCFRRSPAFATFESQKKYIRKVLGLIAYRRNSLLSISNSNPSAIEESESIEQMRLLEYGFRLRSITVHPSLPSVNEPHEAEIVLESTQLDAEQACILKKYTQ